MRVSIDAGLFTLPIYISAYIFYSYETNAMAEELVNLNLKPLNDPTNRVDVAREVVEKLKESRTTLSMSH